MWPEILVIFFLILINGFFAASEIAVVTARKSRIKQLAEAGEKNAAILEKLKEKPDRFLATIQVGITLVGAMAGAIGGASAIEVINPLLEEVPMLGQFSEPVAIGIVAIFITYFSIVIGELIPKSLALSNPEKIGLAVAPVIDIISRLASIVVKLLTLSTNLVLRPFGKKAFSERGYITEEEIKMLIEEGKETGAIEEEEKELLHNVFAFGDKKVTEAMVPRTEIVAVDEEAVVADVLSLVSEAGYSRYPVIKENVDNIIGVLYVKDILRKMSKEEVTSSTPIRTLIRDAYYIPESKMVTALLDEMQKNKFQIAIVLDEHGGTAGLITLEDIMEEIVGGLQDEFEAMESDKDVEVLDERTFVVSGYTGMDEINELVGITLDTEEFHTIGGFLFGLFGRLPKVGEQLRYHGLRFLVLEMDGKKVEKVKITKL